MITSCGSNPEPIDESLITINNLEFHLDKNTSFKDIKYITSESFKEVDMNNYIQYNYLDDNSTNLFFFRIFFYQGKDLSYIKNDLAIDETLELVDGKNANLDYKLIDTKRTDGTIHFYIINKDNTTYVVNRLARFFLFCNFLHI